MVTISRVKNKCQVVHNFGSQTILTISAFKDLQLMMHPINIQAFKQLSLALACDKKYALINAIQFAL